MKASVCILFLTILISSCNNSNVNVKKEIKDQDIFIELVSQRMDSINSCISTNPIQIEKNKNKKRYYTRQYYNILSQYADSVQIINNWTGKVKDFEYRKGEESSFIFLNIEIEYNGDNYKVGYPYDRIILKSIYTIDNNSKENDIVFNNMSNINENSNVYLMGYFNRSMNGHISVGEKFNEFNFTILNISTSPITNNISDNARSAVGEKFKELKIIGSGILNKKTEKQIKKETSFLNMDSIKNTLIDDDKKLLDKIEKSYLLNIAREYIDKK